MISVGRQNSRAWLNFVQPISLQLASYILRLPATLAEPWKRLFRGWSLKSGSHVVVLVVSSFQSSQSSLNRKPIEQNSIHTTWKTQLRWLVWAQSAYVLETQTRKAERMQRLVHLFINQASIYDICYLEKIFMYLRDCTIEWSYTFSPNMSISRLINLNWTRIE